MSEPLIGITSGNRIYENRVEYSCLSRKYTDAIIRAGGIPLILPANVAGERLLELFPTLDGILFSGGDDINPELYGEEQIPETQNILNERDKLEFSLLDFCLEKKKPVFGICRGFQLINVALGGSLYQHILTQYPPAIQHDRHDDLRDMRHHSVTVKPGSLLSKLTHLPAFKVNTLHHQGIRGLSQKLIMNATCSEDGLIESFELNDHPFFLAVQWHPEEIMEFPEQQFLFKAFVEACQKK